MIKNQLLNYITTNVYSFDEVYSILKENNLLRYYPDLSKPKDLDLIKEQWHCQKNKYKLFADEIKIITEKCDKKGIKILALKGIVLAFDLYGSEFYIRNSEDIDLYVDYSDLHEVDNILRNIGYYVNNENTYTNTLYHVTKYPTVRSELTHLAQYHKKVEENADFFTIDIDLHIRPFHYLKNYSKNDSNSIIYRAVRKNISVYNLDVFTTNECDTFIHLAAHYLRHYYWQFLRSLRGEQFSSFLNLLLELCEYYLKYSMYINKEIIERTKILNQLEPVYFVFRIMNEVFPFLVPMNIMQDLWEAFETSKCDNGFCTRFVQKMDKIEAKDLVLSSTNELTAKIYESIIKDSQYSNVMKDHLYEFPIKKTMFNSNQIEITVDNIHKDKYVKTFENMKVESSLRWDENELEVTIKAQKNEMFAESKSNQMFFICRGNHFNQFSEQFSTDKWYYNVSKSIDSSQKTYFTCVTTDEWVLFKSKIPWNVLQILPHNRRILTLNYFIDVYCPESTEAKYFRLSLDNYLSYSIYHPWPTEMMMIKLIK